MKNYEKYADEIKEYKGFSFCKDFILPYVLKSDRCSDITCEACKMRQTVWLLEDCEEPEVDWSKVKVDTPILVRDSEDDKWIKRYFAEYKFGVVHAWNGGCTSWSEDHMTGWKYAKLAGTEEKPEIDWSKVEVDTPILVRYSEKGMWIRRKFAKFEDGVVYAWHGGGKTERSKSYMTPWNYAKLAESERKDNINESNANNRG